MNEWMDVTSLHLISSTAFYYQIQLSFGFIQSLWMLAQPNDSSDEYYG